VHLVAWLRPDADDRAVADAAAARGVNLWPLSLHVLEGQWPPALPAVIACTRTDAARVAAALRAAARGVVGLTPSLGQTDHP
jgi:hypothetical protein